MKLDTEKFKKAILKNYPSIKTFALDIGIPYTTLVTGLKNGIGGMAADKVIMMCDKLAIDIHNLESIKDNPPTVLTLDEKELIKRYRNLSPQEKKLFAEILNRNF